MDGLWQHSKSEIIARVAIAVLLGVAALVWVANARVADEETGGHPFIRPDEMTSKMCLSCHPSKQEGKFVHSAISMGCEKCHQVTSENESTTVKLVAAKAELCAKCHETERHSVIHAPNKSNQCLVCHNPHSSDFPGQTRAPANTLCLSCHGANQPGVGVDFDTREVSLLGGRTIPLETYEAATRIGDPHPRRGVGSALGVPPMGRKPQNPEAARNCLSCHVAHGGRTAHLLRPVS